MPKLALLNEVGGPIELAEYPLAPPGAGAVLLKLRMAGVCGSDVHILKGDLTLFHPYPMGHEMVGEIVELGAGVDSDATGAPIAVGDRIVAPYVWSCGHCRPCSRGHSHACRNLHGGVKRSHTEPPHFIAAHGEYYHTGPGQPLYRVPDDLTDAEATPVNCALSQVLFALKDVRAGDTVVIQGAGGLGVNAAAVARTAGASEVVVVDMVRERLDLAADFGATQCIDATGLEQRELTERVHAHTQGAGADWVLEVAGVPEAVTQGIDFLGNGGTLLELGNVGRGRTVELDPSLLVYGNKTVRGVMLYDPATLATALSFLERTDFPFERLMPAPYRLVDINEAYAAAAAGSVPRAALVP